MAGARASRVRFFPLRRLRLGSGMLIIDDRIHATKLHLVLYPSPNEAFALFTPRAVLTYCRVNDL